MHTALLILAFLLAVGASAMLSRVLPAALPRPLLQIALGAAVVLASQRQIELDPDVFFLLLVPPLLFFDGWRIPKDRLFADRHVILGLALGLVLLTVVGVGYLLLWLLPTLPVGVAFAVAAVVAPTDPIALAGIAQRVPVPRRLLTILQGESLLNDASGLVCLRFATAAVATGTFSIQSAALSFVWVALAGAGVGVALCWVIANLRGKFAQRFGEESASGILLTLLLPFVVYLVAERVGASGILAAAAAGITMTFAALRDASAAGTRIRSQVVWEMVEFLLNGIVFVLLGAQLPLILAAAPQTAAHAGLGSVWALAGCAAALMLALLLLRFCWAWLALRLTLLRKRHATTNSRESSPSPTSPPLRIVAVMTCAGARGAVTLAGVLTLPLLLANGSSLPERDVAIFLATGVILLSLLVASIGLPLLLRGLQLPDNGAAAADEQAARVAAVYAAIAHVSDAAADELQRVDNNGHRSLAAQRVTTRYRNRLDQIESSQHQPAHSNAVDAFEQQLALDAIAVERTTIRKWVKDHKLDSETAHRLLRELDVAEMSAQAKR